MIVTMTESKRCQTKICIVGFAIETFYLLKQLFQIIAYADEIPSNYITRLERNRKKSQIY